jgi:hypothetical protein
MPVEMNLSKIFLRLAPTAIALCAGFFLIPAGRAQPAPPTGGERYLFIFDTSADMKKRLRAVQTEVDTLLSTGLGGQLRPGDTIGVWAFDQDLRAGQFPLQRWRPEDAVAIASSINQFVGRQHYANHTRFNALQPELNQVIRDSERLTVLIFCDGEDEIHWTPYDTGINQIFKQRLAEQKRASQPFVLVLRTQLGQYAGSTMNFPPGMVSVPEFPPLPAPPAPPVVVKAPPPAPVVKLPPIGPPLIIVGTNVETNWPPMPAPPPATNAVPATATNPAPPPPTNWMPSVQTNAASVPSPTLRAPTNVGAPETPVAPPPMKPTPEVQTNAALPPTTNFAPVTPAKPVPALPSNPRIVTNAAAPPETSGAAHTTALVIGAALLFVAGALAALAFFRRRPGRGSLITRSMRKD